jgi:hypothetical protein
VGFETEIQPHEIKVCPRGVTKAVPGARSAASATSLWRFLGSTMTIAPDHGQELFVACAT